MCSAEWTRNMPRVFAVIFGGVMLCVAMGDAQAEGPSTNLGQLQTQKNVHCARADSYDARSRQEKFRATRNRRRYTQRCTAGKRKKNRIFCSRVQRQASRNTSNARRLAGRAGQSTLSCAKYRRLVERAKRRQRLQYNR